VNNLQETKITEQEIKAKRTAKDSVFVDLFKDKKYLLQLYKTLHPEDVTATEDSIEIVTLKTILTDNIYNDLGFTVHGRLLILVEAQSTWSMNILIRMLMYIAQSYNEYFLKTNQDLYKSKKVEMPKPELYVVYTGNKGKRPDIISLSEEYFGGAEIAVEVKAKVIYEQETEDIINQYIVFCKVFNDQRNKYGLTEETVKETIRICKDRNVLREYLESKEKEVVTIMMSLFDEEQIMDVFIKDRTREAKKEGREEGREEGKEEMQIEMAKMLIKKGKMTLDEISECTPSLSMEDLEQIEAEVMNLA
jgi:hypothetical protein